MKEIKTDMLTTQVFPTRLEMGEAAARLTAQKIKEMLKEKDELNILFAAAPSQNEFLAALQQQDIAWDRINALHMDEYIGLSKDAPQGFGNFLREHLFDAVPFRSVQFLYVEHATSEEICQRYQQILIDYPLDIVCMGIGENGHIAFNDPHVADFNDPVTVKEVTLDETCRMQQVHDGCFASIDVVPKSAITVTIPAMMSANTLICVVPGKQKAQAVKNTLFGPISTSCPASILRTHPDATMFCDDACLPLSNS